MIVTKPPRPWIIGAVGLAISVAIALGILIPYGMDPTIFVAFDGESSLQRAYPRQLLGEVTTRPRFAHDGKYFFAQANDPWFLEPERHAAVLDRPLYRGQRMLFPMIAGGFGLFPPRVVVWSMLATNLLALAIGSVLAAKLAASWGQSTWLGLWVPLNIGLAFELDIGGAGILAYMWCLGATYALLRGNMWLASFLFAAAALSREVMVAFALGVLIVWWLDHRTLEWRIVITPLVAMTVWNIYLRFRLMGVSGVGGGWAIFALPFAGIFQSFQIWSTDLGELLIRGLILAIVVAFVPLAVRSRLPIAWGALPFVPLATFLSVNVWRETFDLVRALAPIFTAIPFLFAISNREELRREVNEMQERS